ncbi:hypothetical protein AAF712_002579 [Marasmius tenuissimus]|uniref:Cytochrome b5 heme-binding domain-containing protein n=1 Tax=Marasmius tenuissimus TaxID=585030 RepID=A0ABR3AC01_9AGAR
MSTEKVVTYEELKAANNKSKLYVVISGKVYDATKFIDEHPGGDEVILAEAGAHDATEAFEDVGHSDEARALLPEMLVGTFEDTAKLGGKPSTSNSSHSSSAAAAVETGSNAMYFAPITLLAAYFAWRFYSSA